MIERARDEEKRKINTKTLGVNGVGVRGMSSGTTGVEKLWSSTL